MASKEVNFIEQIKEIRKKIQDSFIRFHDALEAREKVLLSRVEELIEMEFKKNKQEIDKLLDTLKTVKSLSQDKLTDKTLTKTREGVNKLIDDQISEISNQLDHAIEFEWDLEWEASIERIGSIKLNDQSSTSHPQAKLVVPDTFQVKPVVSDTSSPQVKPVAPDTSHLQDKPVAPDTFPPQVKPIVPDYKTKRLPTAYLCKKRTNQKAPGELNCPTSLAIDYKTGNIYIADSDHVQVFNSNGDYIFMLSEKMNKPKGICISLNKVIITQYSGHCMNEYELGGKLVKSVGSEGSGEGQFKHPHGLDVSDRNNNIYVCDCDNNRVQIFTEDLKFHSMLGIGKFYHPRDVKVTRDRVLVLDESNPCLFVFSSDHKLIKRFITRGDGKQILNPICFDIDREYNIIVCDMREPCVYVFSQEGEQIHKFGKQGHDLGDFYFPYGIALDNTGLIIVVCGKDTNCLQMF